MKFSKNKISSTQKKNQVNSCGAMIRGGFREYSQTFVIIEEFQNKSLTTIDECMRVGRKYGYTDYDEGLYYSGYCYFDTMDKYYENYQEEHQENNNIVINQSQSLIQNVNVQDNANG